MNDLEWLFCNDDDWLVRPGRFQRGKSEEITNEYSSSYPKVPSRSTLKVAGDSVAVQFTSYEL